MKKLQMKNNKGITLVALVVTIIILIILAGISINMLVGTDGLITKAKQAKENIELAEIEEQEKLNTLYDRLATGTGPATMYEVIADYQRQINELQTELDILKGNLGENAATSDKILKNYTAYVNGQLVTGTIEDRGTLNWNPSESTSLTIEPGYYSGGTISTENAYQAGYAAGLAAGQTTHTTTYTYPANSTGGTVDLGINHTYRYVNAANVYAKGKADGQAATKSKTLYLYVDDYYDCATVFNGSNKSGGALVTVDFPGGNNYAQKSFTVTI